MPSDPVAALPTALAAAAAEAGWSWRSATDEHGVAAVELVPPDDRSPVPLVVVHALAEGAALERLARDADRGVDEVLFVDPATGALNLRRLRPGGSYRCQLCGIDGGLRLRALPVRLLPERS